MNTTINTILMSDVISEQIKDQIILHIPHSKTNIPIKDGFNLDLIESETNLLVDHATDRIFDLPNIDKLIFEHNRIFCDVERLDDNDEPLFQKGRGFYYTHTDNGEVLRELLPDLKTKIKSDYYNKHHNLLQSITEEKLNKYNSTIIIDCHSFTDEPFKTDMDKTNNRPDICLGVDEYHTPSWLITQLKNGFENHNLSVKINSPYSGTIIPLTYYKKDKRVKGIMIEINRKIYINNGVINDDEVKKLNDIISDILF
jgi:N-formylglutamate amidohydrolase